MFAPTTVVVTVKFAVVAPGATVTLAGVAATAGLALLTLTTAPPLGAALVSVTVPCDVFPPTTVLGFAPTAERLAAAGAACGVKRRVEENGPKTPAELRARTRHQRRCAGRPLKVTCDAVTVGFAMKGAAMVEELSTCTS